MKMYWPTRLISVILAIVGCMFFSNFVGSHLSGFAQTLTLFTGLYITLAVSLNLINGITGQFSIGHFAFYQIGAYTAAAISQAFYKNQPFLGWILLMMAAGALVACLAGFVVGLPSLRLRGDYLAIVTLGFGEIIRISTQNIQYVGAAAGMTVVPSPYSPNPLDKGLLITLAFLLAIFTIAVCRNLLKTAAGLPFLAVREDEVASAAMGVNVTRTKVTAFVLGAAFAGAAGALYAHTNGNIIPSMFTMENSFIVLTMVVLGGTGSITGSVLAAIFLYLLPEQLRNLNNVPLSGFVAAAIAVVLTVTFMKKFIDNFHGASKKRIAVVVGMIVGGVIVELILSIILHSIPKLANTMLMGSQLRLVVFAATLIILMLLRPQGVFAHHEFSWDWLKRVVIRKPELPAVSA